jgi:hypothetical protein
MNSIQKDRGMTTEIVPAKETDEKLNQRIAILTKLESAVQKAHEELQSLTGQPSCHQDKTDHLPLDKWWERALDQTTGELIRELVGDSNVTIKKDEVVKIATAISPGNQPDLPNAKEKLLAFNTQNVRQWFKENYGDLEMVAWNQAIKTFLDSCRPKGIARTTYAEIQKQKLLSAFDLHHPSTIWKNEKTISVKGIQRWEITYSGIAYSNDHEPLCALTRMAHALYTGKPLRQTYLPYPIKALQTAGTLAKDLFTTHPSDIAGVETIRFYKNGRCEVTFSSGIGQQLREKIEAYAKLQTFNTHP